MGGAGEILKFPISLIMSEKVFLIKISRYLIFKIYGA
jgi:hypothetical protein